MQLGQIEARYENDILTLLLIESEASKDPTFTTLNQMVDQLLDRPYRDLGKLITIKSHNNYLVNKIEMEVSMLKTDQDEIKRLQASSVTNVKTLETLEHLLNHEKTLDNILFQAEHKSLFNPTGKTS